VNKEITLLRKFKDRHIVNLIASETSQNSGKREAYLLLEYCPGGHLLARLNSRGGVPLPLSDICRMFTQILDAVAPLHESSPPVTHRDLKLENILFSHDGLIKLCDFGSCAMGYTHLRTAEERSKAEEIISKETTQMYRAPEMVDLYMRDELTEKTDIWVTHSLSLYSNMLLGIGMHSVLSLLHFSSLSRCWKLRNLKCKVKFPSIFFDS
jgi:AP2-associated kinase